jgi:hypothetical protein
VSTTTRTQVTVTMAKFDTVDRFNVVRDGVDIEAFASLTRADYTPRGGTPLRDAVARFIAHLDRQAAEGRVRVGLLLDESGSMGGNEQAVIDGVNEFVGGMRAVDAVDDAAAGKVLAVIVTDGQENSSNEVDPETVKRMIAEREAQGWTFIYLGANQDAWAAGSALGMSGSASGQTVNYTSSPTGLRSAMTETTRRGADYLSDNQAFVVSASAYAQSTLSEDGNLTSDTNSAPAPKSKPYGDVGAALKRARKATSSETP